MFVEKLLTLKPTQRISKIVKKRAIYYSIVKSVGHRFDDRVNFRSGITIGVVHDAVAFFGTAEKE
jgi:hypothetical protein